MKSMKSITVTSSKVFHPAYCPPVEKIILSDSEVEVHFSDKSISMTKLYPTEWKKSVLEAIVKRTYGDVLSDGSISYHGFDEDLSSLYSIAECHKNAKTISVKAAPKYSKVSIPACKTSKIASLLNSSGEFLNAMKCPKASENNEYVRPDKPFKDFTPSEKRAYWRAANQRRKTKRS